MCVNSARIVCSRVYVTVQCLSVCPIYPLLQQHEQAFFCGAAYQKSQSAVFMLPEKGVHSAVVGTNTD